MSNSSFHIDSITSGYRSIRQGSAYNRFLPEPDEKDRVIIQDGEVTDTVDLMKRVVWKYLLDTKEISRELKAKDLVSTCQNIWDFLYHHIQYKLDKPGLEQLRRPARSWAERATGIDCDCFSIFISSILTNLKIPHSFRITKYDSDQYQHVYVVVPHRGSLIKIDPVLSQFNYEKPFSQKKDFAMNLNGIDVAVLSGHNTLNSALLLGSLSEEIAFSDQADAQLEAMLDYLIRTRNAIANSPEIISHYEDPESYLQMLDYAIRYWNTSQRDQALAILIQNEEQLDIRRGLNGSELGGLFSKVGDFVKKVGEGVKDAVTNVTQAVIKYNPISVVARLGFLAAMKLNLKRMASKLKWAYTTQEHAASKGIPYTEWNKAKAGLAKVENLFADKLQGSRDALKDAILKGRAGGLNGDFAGVTLGQLGEPVTVAATITAAAPVIIAAFKMMQDAGLFDKNEQISESGLLNEANNPPAPSLPSPAPPQNDMVYVGPPPPAGGNTYFPTSNPPADQPGSTGGGFIGFVKKNPLIVGLAAAGIGYGAYKVLKPKKRRASGLSGTSRRTKPKPRTGSSKPRSTPPKRRKSGIQQLTLK